MGFIVILLLAIFIVVYAISRICIVHEQTRYVIERLGVPLNKPWKPGLNILLPFCSIRERVDLRQQQLEQQSQVKTKDGVFVNISYIIRFAVSSDDNSVMDFVYKVAEPIKQVAWRVENEIRQIITDLTLEELYSQKDSISVKVVSDQNEKALETGIKILEVVIEQPIPPTEIQQAMNNVVSSKNRKQAAEYDAEAERVKLVGVAKAQAESKHLQGVGIAQQRNAIAEGLKESMDKLLEGGLTTEQSLAILFKTIDADVITTSAIEKSNSLVFVSTALGQCNSDQIFSTLPTVASKEIKETLTKTLGGK